MFLRNLWEISRILQLYNSDIFFPHIDLQHHESATLCSPVTTPVQLNFPGIHLPRYTYRVYPPGAPVYPVATPWYSSVECVCVIFLLFSLYLLLGEFLKATVFFTFQSILPYTPVVHSIMDPSQRECVHIDILKYCLFVEVASGGRVYELVHVRTSIQIAVQRCRT